MNFELCANYIFATDGSLCVKVCFCDQHHDQHHNNHRHRCHCHCRCRCHNNNSQKKKLIAVLPPLFLVKGLLRCVTFVDKTFACHLTPWGHYTAGSTKIQTLVRMWSKPKPSFSHVGELLLKIWTFFWAIFSFFGAQILWLPGRKSQGGWVL